MDKIVNIQSLDPNTFQLQNYSLQEDNLIPGYTKFDIPWNPQEDYIEYFLLDADKNILVSSVTGFPNYYLEDNQIVINPQEDVEGAYSEGQFYTVYNFLKRKLSSTSDNNFYIQEISSDRTELRLNTTDIIDVDVVDLTNQFIAEINSSTVYKDFYLNFGYNNLIIANNIALDTTNPNDPQILIKLYEALPDEFNINSRCWVVEQVAESLVYQVDIQIVLDLEEDLNYIGSPNFNLDIQDQINNSTPYYNLNSLNQNTSLLGSGSLLYQINSILAEKGIEINIDYSDYSQFIHFSSAQTRLENFYYKLALIEEYTYSASLSSNTFNNSFTATSQLIWQNKINEIITNFDGYEYYLYYDSSSYAWPKTNSIFPYLNASVNSLQATTWLNTQLESASYYDSENKDALVNTIPSYLRDDNNNQQYFLFVQMIGQHFDNVWIYLKDITNKFDNDNRLNYGISKDIVAQAIRDLGVKIYQNNFSTSDIYSALLGVTTTGNLLNIPNITGSLPVPPDSGIEYINTIVTASISSSLEPIDNVNKEIYKRIYHNLPILLKKKGTTEGLKILLDIYGIPDTILRVNEFGGKSYQNQSWDNFVDQFNYYAQFQPGAYLDSIFSTNGVNLPYKTIAFRFKPSGIPTQSFSQSLATLYGSSVVGYPATNIYMTFEYTPIPTGSYNGSIESPYNTYGTLKLYDTNLNKSCSVYLPIFDGNWWSVMVTQDYTYPNTTNISNLYVANKIYTGYDGSQIGFIASASILGGQGWGGGDSFFNLSTPINITFAGKTYTPFNGGYQELRYYTEKINENVFKEFVMNPYSIRGNSQTSSYSSITFRAPLGTTLDYTSGSGIYTSIHPAITGSNPIIQSFSYAFNSTYTLNGNYEFIPQTEVIYQDQFSSGIKNSVSEKIRIVNTVLPPGNTLSQYISIQQNPSINEQFTRDVNYFEAAFSPQDEINDDIIAQLGSFNLGSYIGDPRYLISGSLNYYPDFNKLRDYYFSKYIHNYDLNDYIRLIKFYDNSLFKMIKDFTPARAGLASGIVIKQTLLERNRYPQPKVDTRSIITFIGSPITRSFNTPL